jgi:lipoprotein-anchoring transpeptidase ErfK/SrfK
MASGARWLAVLGLATASLIAGCGGCGEDEEPAPQVAVDLYFTSGEQFHKVTRELPAEGDEVGVATEALLAGPTDAERTGNTPAQTAIPERVELVDASLEDGVARVSLSDRFLAGVPRDPAGRDRDQQAIIDARVGQLTYTLAQFEGVRSVAIQAGDQTVAGDQRPADYAKPEQGPALFRAEGERKPKRAKKVPGTRELQERLAKIHFLPRSAVDGVNGYRTQQAVLAFQAWNDLGRDGVVGPQTTAALASAHRPKPHASGPAHRIEVYREKGVALLIEHNKTKRAIHVSSGARGTETPSGTYKVFRKELKSWSVPFQVWLPYASYFNQGIAFHEYPDVPPFPASHGCVRVPAPEAKGVYEFASLGTTVVVL